MFVQGFGFSDLVRRSTKCVEELSHDKLKQGALDLVERLNVLREPRPFVMFVFKKAKEMSKSELC